MSLPRVVIIGGGFAGAFTAKYLQKYAGKSIDVELIDAENYFVFQPLLPEVASGTINAPDAVTPLRYMLPKVRVRMAEVTHVDTESKKVHFLQGSRRIPQYIEYDYLVLAVGQKTNIDIAPGFREHSLAMRDLADAHELRNHIIQCLEHADVTQNAELKKQLLTFVVAGGGFSGVETIGELTEMIKRTLKFYPNISADDIQPVLVQKGDGLLPELAPSLGTYAQKKLEARNVAVILNDSVCTATADAVTLEDGTLIRTKTLVTTVGNGPQPVTGRLGVPLEHGKIKVKRDLSVVNHDNVWAAGDAALIPLHDGGFAPPTAQYATREARCVAKNIIGKVTGKEPQEFAYKPQGSLASIGNYKAVAEVYGVRLSGLLAWMMWRFLYIGMLPGFSTRLRVALNWMFDYFLPRSIVQIATKKESSSQFRCYAKGDIIAEPGQRVDGFYTVISGCLESRTTGPAGTEDFVRILGPGDHWGERALAEDTTVIATLTAVDDSRVMILPAEDFRNLCNTFPALDDYFDKISDKIYAPSLRRHSDG